MSPEQALHQAYRHTAVFSIIILTLILLIPHNTQCYFPPLHTPQGYRCWWEQNNAMPNHLEKICERVK